MFTFYKIFFVFVFWRSKLIQFSAENLKIAKENFKNVHFLLTRKVNLIGNLIWRCLIFSSDRKNLLAQYIKIYLIFFLYYGRNLKALSKIFFYSFFTYFDLSIEEMGELNYESILRLFFQVSMIFIFLFIFLHPLWKLCKTRTAMIIVFSRVFF